MAQTSGTLYLEFYESTVPEEVYGATTFDRIIADHAASEAAFYEPRGVAGAQRWQAGGTGALLLSPALLAGGACVLPAGPVRRFRVRGAGVGRALIEAVYPAKPTRMDARASTG